MKKKHLFGLLLLAPLGLIAVGCGGTAKLSFSPNWYYDNVENTLGKSERLEYDVVFGEPDTPANVQVHYDTGKYITTLTSDSIPQEGENITAYRFETDLRITGYYTRGEEQGEQFSDYMTSKVWFTKAETGLRPIRSEKTVHTTVPYTDSDQPDVWYTAYDFSYTFVYDSGLSHADCVMDITAPESRKGHTESSIKLGFDETFLDNEEIVFALRGLNYSSSLYPFATIDPQTQKGVTVGLSSEKAKQSAKFELVVDGAEPESIDEDVDAVKVTANYNSAQPGPGRTFTYAERTDAGKKFRCVLLRFEESLIYGLGTLTYKLTRATFRG